MTGTVINFFAVIAGSLLGLLAKRGISQRVQNAVLKVQGIAVLVIGINGVICSMISYDAQSKTLSSNGSILLLVSLVVGTIIGETLRIEDRIDGLGQRLQNRFGASAIANGFVSASVLFCVGGMTIIGAINDSMGDSSLLIVKSSLDFVASIILTSSLGIGVMLSCVSVVLYQGGISLLSICLQKLMSGVSSLQNTNILDGFTTDISIVGYAIIICIGLNFVTDAKIKTSNVFPSLLIPIVYNFTTVLKTLW
ncbi:MAG: DUF554 domain-containing protein [Oscillospiraceae bacterium]